LAAVTIECEPPDTLPAAVVATAVSTVTLALP
jgi:hypothetical protein